MQPANRTGLRLGFHQCQMLRWLESSPVQKLLQSRVRGRLARAFGRDMPAAPIADVFAVVGAYLIVASFA